MIPMLPVLLILTSGCCSSEPEPDRAIYREDRTSSHPLFPLLLAQAEVFDHHLLARLKDHPDLSAVEVMYSPGPGGDVRGRAAFLGKDLSLVLVATDPSEVRRLLRVEQPKRSVLGKITIEDTVLEGRPVTAVTVTGPGVPTLEFLPDPSGPSTSGLTEPGPRGKVTHFPLIVRGSSQLASPRSRIRVDGRDWALRVMIQNPFFTGMALFCTQNFFLALFPTIDQSMLAGPVSEKTQVFLVGPPEDTNAKSHVRHTYEIEPLKDSRLQVQSPGNLAVYEQAGSHLCLRTLSFPIRQNTKHPPFIITFSPSLPDWTCLAYARETRGEVSISLDGDELCEGIYRLQRTRSKITLELIWEDPSWARARSLLIHCLRFDSGWILQQKAGPPAGSRQE